MSLLRAALWTLALSGLALMVAAYMWLVVQLMFADDASLHAVGWWLLVGFAVVFLAGCTVYIWLMVGSVRS